MKVKILICVAALCAATISDRSHADNETQWMVKLDFENTALQSVQFDETDQDVGGFAGITTSISDDGEALITVGGSIGGNTLSTDKGEWFQNQVSTGAAIGCNSSSELPKKLYLAFTGELSVTLNDGNQLECENVVMGLGSVDVAHNNWWLGGPGMSKTSTGNLQQTCTYNGSTKIVTFSAPSGCENLFSASVPSE